MNLGLVILNLLTAIAAGAASYFYFMAGSVVFGWIWIAIALTWIACAAINNQTRLEKKAAERRRVERIQYEWAHMFDGYESWVDRARKERENP